MHQAIYRYEFGEDLPMEDAQASLLLAIIGTESLHGETTVQLTLCHAMNVEGRSCVINAETAVGSDLNRLFTGFLRREFGPRAFRVRRIIDRVKGKSTAAA